MYIEEIDDYGSSLETQLGFNVDDIQPSGWLSRLGSAVSTIGNAASSIKKKASHLKHSLLGRAVQSSVVEGLGGYAGGTIASRVAGSVFQPAVFGSGAIVVGSTSALVLMNSDKAETRKWAFVTITAASLASLLTFFYPEMSFAVGMCEMAGNVVGGYFALRMMGDTRRLIDFENPSSSYVARALPAMLLPACMDVVAPIQNRTLNGMRCLAVSNVAYYAIPIAANPDVLLLPERRFELLAAPQMMRSLLSMTEEEGISGVARYWASCITTNQLVSQFVGHEIFKILEGDQAYNVIARTVNHYNEFLRSDPEIQQAVVEFRAAFERGEESAVLATVLSEKMVAKFPKLRLMPDQVDGILKGVSGNIASAVASAIQRLEPRLYGVHLTSESDLAYLERFLTVYFGAFLPYALMKVVPFQEALTAQETQLFYRNLNQMIGELYVQRLPIVGRAAGLLEGGVDRVIEEVVLPISEQEQQEPVKEKSAGLVRWLLSVSCFVAHELYRFLAYIFLGKTLPDFAPGQNSQ